jgi:hypothetical protein
MKGVHLAAAALALACGWAASNAAPAADTPAPDTSPTAGACFWARDVYHHTSDGRHTLYFNVSHRSVWRVETDGACLAAAMLSDRVELRAAAAGGQVCAPLDRDLRVRGAHCLVTEVAKLTPQEVAALPSALRPTGHMSLAPPRLPGPRSPGANESGLVTGIGSLGGAASPH